MGSTHLAPDSSSVSRLFIPRPSSGIPIPHPIAGGDGVPYYLRRARQGSYVLRVDVRGRNSLTDAEFNLVDSALEWIWDHRNDLRDVAVVANAADDPFCRNGKAGRWGGHRTGSVFENVDRVLRSGAIKIRDGRGNDRTNCRAGVSATVQCRDIGDGRWGTIWLCRDFFQEDSQNDRAEILLHEVLHLLGADEAAAWAMAQGALRW